MASVVGADVSSVGEALLRFYWIKAAAELDGLEVLVSQADWLTLRSDPSDSLNRHTKGPPGSHDNCACTPTMFL